MHAYDTLLSKYPPVNVKKISAHYLISVHGKQMYKLHVFCNRTFNLSTKKDHVFN